MQKTVTKTNGDNSGVAFANTVLPDVIELNNVAITYNDGQSYVIKDFSLLIEDKPQQGQFVVILGPSGCGKSTILRFITGIQQPTAGQVLIKGKPLSEYDAAISMVFQQYSSFPWYTVLENVMLPLLYQGVAKKERRDRAMAMIEKVGLTGHEQKYAKIPLLSGGQLQRVAIARSLILNPEIILMDEPFGALDLNTRSKMQLLLAKIWLDIDPTIIFVTHDIREAVFLGDDIYIMTKNPAYIVKHIPVDLPMERNKETKRSQRFIELTAEVEDAMEELEKNSGNSK